MTSAFDNRDVSGRIQSKGGVKAAAPSLLPSEGFCSHCGKLKPIGEMLVVHRKREGDYYMRPRCKQCHNKRERGHRREYKRNYLRAWRKRNAALNESYWRDAPDRKAKAIA